MTISETKNIKKQLLRNNEYYNTQKIHDELYRMSKEGYIFKDLISEIIKENNILLAYRNIKNNDGSETAGINENTIEDIKIREISEWINYMQDRIKNFTPHPVRRVEIDKPDGGKRPLGIPTIEDRLLQQCIKQIIEPIAEAKFYHGSYGFRPDRSPENAIAKIMQLINLNKLHYAVDIDIKAFFDNVNHGKLIKQMWAMGIRDKELISIISKMLKAEIKDVGIPDKGTPQGGICSTLLSNIVLNELDWWVYSQWEGIKTKCCYKSNLHKNKVLKERSRLKEMYIVRYADDFKILCRDAKSAQKTFVAVSKWLKERLGLEINKAKSKVINLRKNHSSFLGFKMKVINKRNKKVVRSKITDKAKNKIEKEYRNQIEKIRKRPNTQEIMNLNSMILGWHNYYSIATLVNLDFSEINFLVRKRLLNRTRRIRSDTLYASKTYKRLYGEYNFKPVSIGKITIFPLAAVKFKIPKNIKNLSSRYTITGRYYIHKQLPKEYSEAIKYLLNNPLKGETLEINDNRISLYVGQKGLCHISKMHLKIDTMIIRHKCPKVNGGKDTYNNLILVNKEISNLIDEKENENINQYKERLNLDVKALEKLNKLRKLIGNPMI